MSYLNKLVLVFLTLTSMGQTAAFAQNTNVSRYKCMIQMTNYVGDGAYIVISLIDGKGAYEKTLYVLGSNKKWYSSLKEWSNTSLRDLRNLVASRAHPCQAAIAACSTSNLTIQK